MKVVSSDRRRWPPGQRRPVVARLLCARHPLGLARLLLARTSLAPRSGLRLLLVAEARHDATLGLAERTEPADDDGGRGGGRLAVDIDAAPTSRWNGALLDDFWAAFEFDEEEGGNQRRSPGRIRFLSTVSSRARH